MIKLFDHVEIKETGVTGIVVDVSKVNGQTRYEVEADQKGTQGGYGEKNSWKLYACIADELRKL